MTSAKLLIFIGFLGLASCQTQQTINLDGNDQLKLRIVFQPEQQQQSPCASGNCGQQVQQQVQQNPCASGNCGASVQTSSCASGNCGQQVQQSSPCASGNCGSSSSVQSSPCASGNCGQQVQQSPCASGNCGSSSSCSSGNCGSSSSVQASPCSTGNCPSYDSTTTTTQAPVTIQASNVKVIRIPSYSSGCNSNGCGWFRPRCPGCRRRFFMPPPRFFGPRMFGGNNNNGGSIGIPDTVFSNGRAYNAPIRIPSSYSDGNPVFGRGK